MSNQDRAQAVPGRPEAAASPLQELLARRSVGSRHLVDPGPDADQLRWMAQLACRAPDHGALRPFRFQVVSGTARLRMADVFAAAARDAGKDAQGAVLDADRAARSPVTVAVIARITADHAAVPAQEQWMAVGGAIANFLNAAHLLGFAGQMLSGAKVRQPRLIEAFCSSGETLVGWIALGTASAAWQKDIRFGQVDPPIANWTEEPGAPGPGLET